jgi:ribosomal protein L22
MSADDEKDPAGDVPAEPKAKKAPRKAAAKKPAAKAAARAEQSSAEGAEKAPAKKRAARKPAAKKAAAAKAPVAEQEPVEAPAKPAAKPAATPARRAGKRPEAPRRRVVRARARFVRTSARKARMVCGHLRGKSVQEARAILAFTPREVARDWSKLLESAVANAESNHELLEDDLIVREAYADEGPTIKRFRPRAMGRATPIRKRTSHLTITLTPRPEPANNKRNG